MVRGRVVKGCKLGVVVGGCVVVLGLHQHLLLVK